MKDCRRAPDCRLLCLVLSGMLFFAAASQAFVTARAFAGEPTPQNTPKEEVVYAKLLADGRPDGVYVVNSFENPDKKMIVDYGRYAKIRNMSTTDPIVIDGDRITAPGKSGKFFYEGTLKKAELPWLFHVRYYLDDREIRPDKLAGRSGALRMELIIRRNPAGNALYFKHLTLQAGLRLDSTKCSDVRADDATIANAGKDKQIAFTLMPNQEKTLVVTARVKDFEFGGISINAVNTTLDFDINGNDLLGSKVNELKDGVAKLDDGAIELKDGSGKLNDRFGEFVDGVTKAKDGSFKLRDGASDAVDGATKLKDGAVKLDDGVVKLNDGAGKLSSGAYDLYHGLNDFAGGTVDLSDALGTLNRSVAQLSGGAGRLYSEGLAPLKEQSTLLAGGATTLSGGMQQLSAQNEGLIAFSNGLFLQTLTQANQNPAFAALGITESSTAADIQQIIAAVQESVDEQTLRLLQVLAYYKGVAAYVAGVGQLSTGAAGVADGLNQLANGTVVLADNGSQLADGLARLNQGTEQLASKSVEFRDGAVKLADGGRDLYGGASDLSSGVKELQTGTADLVSGVIDFRDGTIKLHDGTTTFADGMIDLEKGSFDIRDAIAKLFDGIVKLADGTSEFRSKTATLEKDLPKIIKDKILELMGGDFRPVSFVSAKNTRTDSVQFVMQTHSIKIPKADIPKDKSTKPSTLWERIVALFRSLF